MHTGDPQWRSRGLGAICNCCACDCYPFRAAQVLGSKGTWPQSRYLAHYDPEACNLCGACVKRCHFGAFYHEGEREVAPASRPARSGARVKAAVSYNPALCWGCGLCANTCPSGAITMEPLP
jgi:NAD-dependent dihydropyrimidine dehydrogenase PreA subunit